MKCVIVRYELTLLLVGYNVHRVPFTLSGTSESCSQGSKEEYFRYISIGFFAMPHLYDVSLKTVSGL